MPLPGLKLSPEGREGDVNNTLVLDGLHNSGSIGIEDLDAAKSARISPCISARTSLGSSSLRGGDGCKEATISRVAVDLDCALGPVHQ